MTVNTNITTNDFKTCFIIATAGHGKGGHARSLKTTIEAISRQINCFVIHIGLKPSTVIQSIKTKVYFIPFSGFNFYSTIRQVSKIVGQEKPDSINSFDISAHFFGQLMSIRYRLPIIITKCGGPSPKYYFPYADQLIVYSLENFRYFSRTRRFSGTPVHLIPNRVVPFECDPASVTSFRQKICDKKPCFLRINRFVSNYEQSMVQAITLIRRLNQDGHPCQLAIVGVIENPDVFNRIRLQCNQNIHLFIEHEFTSDARRILDAVDFVIGTGRGFMEAACHGKILLTPLQGARYPLLVTEDNFDQVFATNFSQRNRIENFDEEDNYQKIARLLDDTKEQDRLRKYSQNLFDRYFNINSITARYESILRQTRSNRQFRPFQLIGNGLWCIRNFTQNRIPRSKITDFADI